MPVSSATPSPAAMSAAWVLIEQRFPGVALIPLTAVAKFIGIAHQSARNQLHAGRFPLHTIKQGHTRYVPAHALAAYYATMLPGDFAAPEPLQAKASGRPRKIVAAGKGGAL